MGWITELTQWLETAYDDGIAWLQGSYDGIKSFWDDTYTEATEFLRTLVHDTLLAALDMTLGVARSVLEQIPAPTFLEGHSLDSILSQGGPWVAFMVGQLGLAECFSVIGAAYSFRLIRKIATMGKW